ncbi:MAG TPA: rhodanese-like domain-containing protein, partial [Candidatus Hydrogenedentes bacterium]|nr:rhodanese-like domain-containing protein [Candidatus Hydrogenedentota bacterium]
ITGLIDYEQFCGIRGEESPAVSESAQEEVSVSELKAKMDRRDDFDILDVRNPEEWRICRIEEAILIPLGELAARLNELDPAREILVHCKSGARSAKAVELLRASGFASARNVKGGILAWAEEIDPSIPTY